MKINISSIVKTSGASIDVEYNEYLEDLKKLSSDYDFIKPIKFIGKIVNNNEVLKLEGNITTEFVSKCNLCMKEVKKNINITFQEELVEAHKKSDSLKLHDLNNKMDEDESSYTYEGNYLDIDKILFDQIALKLPMRVLCDEDCKGLCVNCGVNLNESQCTCMKIDYDDRFEALKNYFNE